MLPGYRTRGVYGVSLVMAIVILVVWMLLLSLLGQPKNITLFLVVATAMLAVIFAFTTMIVIMRR